MTVRRLWSRPGSRASDSRAVTATRRGAASGANLHDLTAKEARWARYAQLERAAIVERIAQAGDCHRLASPAALVDVPTGSAMKEAA